MKMIGPILRFLFKSIYSSPKGLAGARYISRIFTLVFSIETASCQTSLSMLALSTFLLLRREGQTYHHAELTMWCFWRGEIRACDMKVLLESSVNAAYHSLMAWSSKVLMLSKHEQVVVVLKPICSIQELKLKYQNCKFYEVFIKNVKFLIYTKKSFPVDARHNSKLRRDLLSKWAKNKL